MFSKYARYYDLFNQNKPYKKEIEFVYQWAKKPRTIFDIGPGTGNYWKFYPKKTVLFGVEKSKSMADRANVVEEIVCADIRNFRMESRFDCATALFDVINYISTNDWWKNIPVKKGGYFIFDIWDKEKVNQDGFIIKAKANGTSIRIITPIGYDGKSVRLNISVFENDLPQFEEIHQMYVYSHEDILRFCGKEFEVAEVKPTERWQAWYKLRRK